MPNIQNHLAVGNNYPDHWDTHEECAVCRVEDYREDMMYIKHSYICIECYNKIKIKTT